MSFLHSSRSSESVVGIDIGASSVKVVQLKKKGSKAVLETYGALALGPYGGSDVGTITNLPVDKLAQALTDVTRESGVTTPEASVSIPSSASLIFLIDLPAVLDEKQIPTIVPTEARKYIPVPISEVSLDFWVIPKREESFEQSEAGKVAEKPKTEVLIAAIHNDTITKYKDIIKNTKLNSHFFEIEVFSAIRSTFNHELSSVLLLDMGASRTKLSIIEYGIVRSFHIVNRGSHDISSTLATSLGVPFAQAEEMKREFGLYGSPTNKNIAEVTKLTVDYILSETNSVVLNYEKKYNKTISKVILTGGGVLLKGFIELARDNFRSEVILGNPFGKVEVPSFVAGVLAETGPEFSVALGLALRELEG